MGIKVLTDPIKGRVKVYQTLRMYVILSKRQGVSTPPRYDFTPLTDSWTVSGGGFDVGLTNLGVGIRVDVITSSRSRRDFLPTSVDEKESSRRSSLSSVDIGDTPKYGKYASVLHYLPVDIQ